MHIKYGQVTARIFSDFQVPLYTTEVHIKYGQVTARIFSDFQAPLYTTEVHIKYQPYNISKEKLDVSHS